MEFLIRCGTEIGKQIINSLWVPLKSRVSYLVCYKRKVEELSKSVVKLEPAKNDLLRSVEAANRRCEVVNDVVNAWLTRVGGLEEDARRMTAATEENKRCFKGCCPDLTSRYKLGKEAAEKSLIVDELQKEGNFSEVSQLPPPPGIESMPIGDFEAFGATTEAMRKVMDALEDEMIYLIGIYGMGGIGKTTLMKEIGRRLKETNKFDVVIMVVVSQSPDLKEIQRNIAEQLGMTLRVDSEFAASALSVRLKKEKNVLIMLDDLWTRLELSEVGIAYGHEHKGCKVLLTTRKHEVCHLMESHAVPIDVLSDKDSWNLFQSKAGNVVKSPDLELVARKVAKECGGLPLAIVVVGRALRVYNDKSVWEDALVQLNRSSPTNLEGVEEKLFKSLELSYNHLKDGGMKLLFMFCCLFREDYEISEDELTRYAMGEGFLNSVYTLSETRSHVHFLVEKLKASCLLLTSDKIRCVKMHDVVRDVAVYITNKGLDGIFVKAGLGLRDWPEKEKLETIKRISLMNNGISALPDQPKCEQLLTLLLRSSPSLNDIPNNFFKGMETLTVLDISDSNISSLPSSLLGLTNLRTLCLDRCKRLRDISLVGQLKGLEILGLQKCSVNLLPEELGNLANLKLLDLSFSNSLRVPTNVLCKLSRLEELYMISCTIKEAVFTEIASLQKLIVLQVYIKDIKYFSQDVVPLGAWENLREFAFYTELDWFVHTTVYQKNLLLKGVSHIADWVKILFRKTQHLILDDCKWDFDNLVQLDERGGFESLKSLRLTRCNHIEFLLNTTQNEVPPCAFGNLEVLNLWRIENLSGIFNGMLPTPSFAKLRMVDILGCKKLVHILPWDLLKSVHDSLEELSARDCDLPQEVFHSEGLDEGRLLLAKLRMLRLHVYQN